MDVWIFLISLGRAQLTDGWVFDQFNSDNNRIVNWSQSAKEFLFWSQGSWANGNYITLSPLASQIKYQQKFGNIQQVTGVIAGSYPLLDKNFNPIQNNQIEVLRQAEQPLPISRVSLLTM